MDEWMDGWMNGQDDEKTVKWAAVEDKKGKWTNELK